MCVCMYVYEYVYVYVDMVPSYINQQSTQSPTYMPISQIDLGDPSTEISFLGDSRLCQVDN